MKAPTLSGFCSATVDQPDAWQHEWCRLPGCACSCHTPPEVPDDLEPAGVQLLMCDPHDWPAAAAPTMLEAFTTHAEHAATLTEQPAAAVLVELTRDECRRIIAAHLELRPARMLETVRTILKERLNP